MSSPINIEKLRKMVAEVAADAAKKAAAENASNPMAELVSEMRAHRESMSQEEVQAMGIKAGRYLRALAAGGGDIEKAAHFAKKTLEDEGICKALGTGTGEDGGFLVPEEISSDFIELLRPASVVRRLNPLVVPMKSGVMTINGMASGASASYIGESQAQNASQGTFRNLRLTWKKLKAVVPISNELLRYSSPSADSIVRDDAVTAVATRGDVAFIRGAGGEFSPRGLRHWALAANVTASNGVTAAQVEQDLTDLIEGMQGRNVPMLRPAWMMSSRTKNFMLMLRDSSGNKIFPELAGTNPTLLGWPVGVTNNIPNNLNTNKSEIYLADMAQVVIGEGSQLEVQVSTEATYTDSEGVMQSAFDRDETVLKVIERHDLVVRHEAAIAVKTDVAYGNGA